MGRQMIWAQSLDGIIGQDGELPWHVPADLARFKAITQGETVIMGRKTWESLPPTVRPLPDRTNLVISRDEDARFEGALTVSLGILDALNDYIVIGGGEIYTIALNKVDTIHQTLIGVNLAGNAQYETYAPHIPDTFTPIYDSGWLDDGPGTIDYRFITHSRNQPAAV